MPTSRDQRRSERAGITRVAPRRRHSGCGLFVAALTCLVGIQGMDESRASSDSTRLVDMGDRQWAYALRWAVSSDDVLFGTIATADQDSAGLVVVLADGQLGNVIVLAAEDGALIEHYSVIGGGPGRVTRLSGLIAFGPERILVYQAFPGRLEMIQQNGTPIKTLRLDSTAEEPVLCAGLRQCAGRRAALIARTRYGTDAAARRYESRYEIRVLGDALEMASPSYAVTLMGEDRPRTIDETQGYFPTDAWAVLPDGRTIVAPARDLYRLEIRDPSDARGQVLVRDVVPPPRTKLEIAAIRSRYSVVKNGVPQDLTFRLLDTAPVVDRITPLANGQLVVRTGAWIESHDATGALIVDLVDPKARTVHRIRCAVPFKPLIDMLVMLPDRSVIVVKEQRWKLAPAAEERPLVVPEIQYWEYQEELVCD